MVWRASLSAFGYATGAFIYLGNCFLFIAALHARLGKVRRIGISGLIFYALWR
jgi:hypothetical protein